MHQGLKIGSPVCFLLRTAELLKAKGAGNRFLWSPCPLVWWHTGWDSKLPRKQSNRKPRDQLPLILYCCRSFHLTNLWALHALLAIPSLLLKAKSISYLSKIHLITPETPETCVKPVYWWGTEIQALSEQKSVQRRIPASSLKIFVLSVTAFQQETKTGELVPLYLTAVLWEEHIPQSSQRQKEDQIWCWLLGSLCHNTPSSPAIEKAWSFWTVRAQETGSPVVLWCRALIPHLSTAHCFQSCFLHLQKQP